MEQNPAIFIAPLSINYTAIFYQLGYIHQVVLSEIYAACQICLKLTNAWILHICFIKLYICFIKLINVKEIFKNE